MKLSAKRVKESALYSVVSLEAMFPHHTRHTVYRMLEVVIVTLILFFAFTFLLSRLSLFDTRTSNALASILPELFGALLIFLAALLALYPLEVFFRSRYFSTYARGGKGDAAHEIDICSMNVLRVLYQGTGGITGSFFRNDIGIRTMERCGISFKEATEFAYNRHGPAELDADPRDYPNGISIVELSRLLFAADKEFSGFLLGKGITKEHLAGAARWAIREQDREKEREQWWSRKHLSSVQGIGEDWSYGTAYAVQRYGRELSYEDLAAVSEIDSLRTEHEVTELVAVLSRAREANALLVGMEGAGKLGVIRALHGLIVAGAVPRALLYKRIVILDTTGLIANAGDKTRFEGALIKVFEEAIHAGNIILVIENFPAFVVSARTIGSDAVDVLEPYLAGTRIQVIATADTKAFHDVLAPDTRVMRRFERITVEEPEGDAVIAILEQAAEHLEKKRGRKMLCTYPALVAVAESAENYFPDTVMLDKAIDLTIEIFSLAASRRRMMIGKDDVLALVRAKTNIPVGAIGGEEQQLLMSLEDVLHRYVVGQDEAVNNISAAIRRARTGVRNLKRPIGSFLFLGPTGVGKTETGKALARVLFGDEKKLSRLDMSEYKTADALPRLIGIVGTGEQGNLVKILKETPYTVLLLDEFEKTTKEVMDLFLQILDEGIFSDAWGGKVNARNTVVIATSNAGSDMIWDTVERGGDLASKRDSIIEWLIGKGMFKPELLNRFDSIVLFHPLSKKNLGAIAVTMLVELKERLMAEKGIDLSITDALVQHVMRAGYHPEFGARPMRRVIQADIEERIAQKLIRGEIRSGATVSFGESEL